MSEKSVFYLVRPQFQKIHQVCGSSTKLKATKKATQEALDLIDQIDKKKIFSDEEITLTIYKPLKHSLLSGEFQLIHPALTILKKIIGSQQFNIKIKIEDVILLDILLDEIISCLRFSNNQIELLISQTLLEISLLKSQVIHKGILLKITNKIFHLYSESNDGLVSSTCKISLSKIITNISTKIKEGKKKQIEKSQQEKIDSSTIKKESNENFKELEIKTYENENEKENENKNEKEKEKEIENEKENEIEKETEKEKEKERGKEKQSLDEEEKVDNKDQKNEKKKQTKIIKLDIKFDPKIKINLNFLDEKEEKKNEKEIKKEFNQKKPFFNNLYEKDLFMIFKSLCQEAMKKITKKSEDNDSVTVELKKKLFCFDLILEILNQNEGIVNNDDNKSDQFLKIIKEKLFKAINKCASSKNLKLLKVSHQIFLKIFEKYRRYLKSEILFFIQLNILTFLEDPQRNFVEKIKVFKLLFELFQEPQNIVEMYFNCDYLPRKMNNKNEDGKEKEKKKKEEEKEEMEEEEEEEEMEKQEEKEEEEEKNNDNNNNNNNNKNNSGNDGKNELFRLMIQRISQIVLGNDLEKQINSRARYFTLIDFTKLRNLGFKILIICIRSMYLWCENLFLHQEQNYLLYSKYSTNQLFQKKQNEQNKIKTKKEKEIKKKINNQIEDTIIAKGCILFNENTKKGINFLLNKKKIKKEPLSIFNFIKKYKNYLFKKKIGEFFGSSKNLNSMVFDIYIQKYDFTNLNLINSLIILFKNFSLPDSKKKIDTILEKFSEQYYLSHKSIFKSANSTFLLCYQVLELFFNLKNKDIKEKITKTIFIQQNVKLDSRKYISNEYLSELFDSINNIIQNNSTNIGSDGDDDDDDYDDEGDDYNYEIELNKKTISFNFSKKVEKHFLFWFNYLIFKTKSKEKILKMNQNRINNNEKLPKEDYFYPITLNYYVKPMVKLLWKELINSTSMILNKTQDLKIIKYCISGFKFLIKLTSIFSLDHIKDKIIIKLLEFINITNRKEMTKKIHFILKEIINFLINDGNYIGTSWHHFFKIFLQLFELNIVHFLLSTKIKIFNNLKKKENNNDDDDDKNDDVDGDNYEEEDDDDDENDLQDLEEIYYNKKNNETNLSEFQGTLLNDDKLEEYEKIESINIEEIFINTKKLNELSITIFLRQYLHTLTIKVLNNNVNFKIFLEKVFNIALYNINRPKNIHLQIFNLINIFLVQFQNSNEINLLIIVNYLRRIIIYFLNKKKELLNYEFQYQLFLPYNFFIQNIQNNKVITYILQTTNYIINKENQNLKSAWQIIFNILLSCSNLSNELVLRESFQMLQNISNNHFDKIQKKHLILCITTFFNFVENGINPTINFQALEQIAKFYKWIEDNQQVLLKDYININKKKKINEIIINDEKEGKRKEKEKEKEKEYGKGKEIEIEKEKEKEIEIEKEKEKEKGKEIEIGEKEKDKNESSKKVVNDNNLQDLIFTYYFPFYTGLSKISSSTSTLISNEVKVYANKLLFNILIKTGDKINKSTWILIFKSVILPIFDDIFIHNINNNNNNNETNFNNNSTNNKNYWLKSIYFDFFNQVIQLFIVLYDKINFLIKDFINFFDKIFKENVVFASVVVNSFGKLIEDQKNNFSKQISKLFITYFCKLLELTKSEILIQNIIKNNKEKFFNIDDEDENNEVISSKTFSINQTEKLPNKNHNESNNDEDEDEDGDRYDDNTNSVIDKMDQFSELNNLVEKIIELAPTIHSHSIIHLKLLKMLLYSFSFLFEKIDKNEILLCLKSIKNSFIFSQLFEKNLNLRILLFQRNFTTTQIPNLLKHEYYAKKAYLSCLNCLTQSNNKDFKLIAEKRNYFKNILLFLKNYNNKIIQITEKNIPMLPQEFFNFGYQKKLLLELECTLIESEKVIVYILQSINQLDESSFKKFLFNDGYDQLSQLLFSQNQFIKTELSKVFERIGKVYKIL
ncbi:hypothetical protein M0812_17013 [Anaeramoeba flamelloides]|uniref:SEC7 domain-containing protein n=1 Tax=Anaeramoeba flamelloides TaxID=1746091 RepID=A0AAV7ZAM5_9EUKA|nr:hypothetical protein M0812_17013 [Anaeramoeba flamelloides]